MPNLMLWWVLCHALRRVLQPNEVQMLLASPTHHLLLKLLLCCVMLCCVQGVAA